MTFEEHNNTLLNVAKEIFFEGIIWTRYTIMTNNFIVFHILTILLQILPAVLIDLILKFSGRRPMMIQLQRRLYVVSCFIGYFLCNKWEFCNINSSTLISSISSDDRDTFSFEYSDIDLYEYYKNGAIGAKKFLLHEDMNRLDAAKAHAK
ncbi:PREDICTED: fatty acyl-CoA reductase 1-like, partial [Wasmannia auropunctata]|uniref:fatty acyl-CoA reductase 1-like n=1 Tax=Wasmannia auropunctata TaxID=64793 RepID=UPI0005F056F2